MQTLKEKIDSARKLLLAVRREVAPLEKVKETLAAILEPKLRKPRTLKLNPHDSRRPDEFKVRGRKPKAQKESEEESEEGDDEGEGQQGGPI